MKNSKIKQKIRPTAYSEWVNAYMQGKNCYPTGEATSNYEDKTPRKSERETPVREHQGSLEIAKSDSVAKAS